MDKIAAISTRYISRQQKREELAERLLILEKMAVALARMVPKIEARMKKASDAGEGMKLFQQLQAAKILAPKLEQRLDNYRSQIRELKRGE